MIERSEDATSIIHGTYKMIIIVMIEDVDECKSLFVGRAARFKVTGRVAMERAWTNHFLRIKIKCVMGRLVTAFFFAPLLNLQHLLKTVLISPL